MEVGIWTVFWAASLTAIATRLGALPFLFVRNISRRWLGISNAMAAGLMLAASHALIAEGYVYGPARTVLGILIGVLLIAASYRVVERYDYRHLNVDELRRADVTRMLMIVGVMTLHSISEGVGVGVAFGVGDKLGSFITAAIAVHNIPEGLAISLVLVPRGTGVLAAALWSVFSSLPQPVMAVPTFLFIEIFQPLLPIGLGLAAGAMIWMTIAELIPESLENTSSSTVAISVTVSIAAMLAFQEFLLKF